MRTQSLLIALIAFTAPSAAFTPAATAATKSASCSVQAKKKDLTGAHRAAFMKTCEEGALTTTKPTLGASASRSEQAITAPSGADRNTRAAQCSAAALRRHLSEIKAKEFRLSCMATAGPVQESQDQTQAPKPSPAKPGLDTLPRPHQD